MFNKHILTFFSLLIKGKDFQFLILLVISCNFSRLAISIAGTGTDPRVISALLLHPGQDRLGFMKQSIVGTFGAASVTVQNAMKRASNTTGLHTPAVAETIPATGCRRHEKSMYTRRDFAPETIYRQITLCLREGV